ncbi:hypothetical protein FRB99_007843 [Tulasnella sp. 403]|nr:hypothetical protein FRB99_007843 [Tulasnella sp. 403]
MAASPASAKSKSLAGNASVMTAVESQSRFSIDSEMIFTHGIALDAAHKNAGGAPVEDESPMGKEMGWWSLVLLNFSIMIGTGIFSIPGTLVKQTGSIGLALIYWFIGFLIAMAGFSYYIELAAAYPDRAGADVVYFEQVYKRPKFFFPATYAAITLLLGFNSSTCIIFAQYALYAHGDEHPSDWVQRGIAVAMYAVVCLCVMLSTRWSLRLSNVFSVVKVIAVLFVVVVGWVVLAGGTKVEGARSHFKQPFKGTNSNPNDLASALVNIYYCYSGFNGSNMVVNEVSGNKIWKLKTSGFMAISCVCFLYMFANVAYFAAVPVEEAKASGQLIAAVFFTKIFGEYAGKKVLPALISLSAFGNVLSSTICQARMVREIARQGVVPFSAFFSSTKPFGTPAPVIVFMFLINTIVVVAPPAGDAFIFLISLQVYPLRLFDVLLIVGVWVLRRRRQRAGIPRLEFQAWNIALVFAILICLFILVMPWVPPKTGQFGGSVSFWYATAPATGIGILVACFIYWYVWARALPRFFDYTICEEITRGENGELSKRFVRVYNDERGDEWRKRKGHEGEEEELPKATGADDIELNEPSRPKSADQAPPQLTVSLTP